MVHVRCSRSEMLQFTKKLTNYRKSVIWHVFNKQQEDGLNLLRILSVSPYSNNCVGELPLRVIRAYMHFIYM